MKKATAEKRSDTKIVCENCKKEFEPYFYNNTKLQKFCSPDCNQSSYNKKRRNIRGSKKYKEAKIPLICIACGSDFLGTISTQKYCSTNCKIEFHKTKWRENTKSERDLIKRVCPCCDQEFTPKTTLKQRYCSRKCRELFPKKIYKALQTCLKYSGEDKSDHTHKLLGYTPKELQEHIINHPNWALVKDGNWHLDHIFPIAAFIEHGITDPAIICRLDNLQPLSEIENCSKNCKYDKNKFTDWLNSVLP